MVVDVRVRYLNLLRLALCDYVNPRSSWTGERFDSGEIRPKLLTGRDLQINRTLGHDWPLYAMTMTGLDRLADLQRCVEQLVADGVPGDVIEAGVWRGGSSMMMRATLDSLGEDHRKVWLADSFQGFRSSQPDSYFESFLSRYELLAVSQEEVEENFVHLGLDHNLRFVPGYFDEGSLDGLAGERWALIRLDGDTYGATTATLEALYPRLEPGGFVIIDDYCIIKECRDAVDSFRHRHGIGEPIDRVDWNFARWRRAR